MPMFTPPFQRRITNPLQRPLSSDLNLQAFYDATTQAYLAAATYSASPEANIDDLDGFVANSLRCTASTTSRAVVVQRGFGFLPAVEQQNIDGIVGVNSVVYAPIVCSPDITESGVSLPCDSLAAGLNRIDAVCVTSRNEPVAYENIGLLNPASSTFSFASKPTQFTENISSGDTEFLRIIKGTETSGVPVAPAIPSGYERLANVYVPSGTGNLSNSNIEDERKVLVPHGARSMTLSFLTNITTSQVLGFDFDGNGVFAAVRKVVDTDENCRWYEVFVSSGRSAGNIEMVAGGWASGDATGTPTNLVQSGFMTSVYSEETVTRATALPVFESAGAQYAAIGTVIKKFVVIAGFLDKSGVQDNCYINISDTSVLNAGTRRIRLSLFQSE